MGDGGVGGEIMVKRKGERNRAGESLERLEKIIVRRRGKEEKCEKEERDMEEGIKQ